MTTNYPQFLKRWFPPLNIYRYKKLKIVSDNTHYREHQLYLHCVTVLNDGQPSYTLYTATTCPCKNIRVKWLETKNTKFNISPQNLQQHRKEFLTHLQNAKLQGRLF